MQTAITTFAAINIVLICSLLIIYGKNLKTIRSAFTAGLTLFALLFLSHNIILFYFSVTMMPLYVASVGVYILLFTVLQTIAFAILNWVTWK